LCVFFCVMSFPVMLFLSWSWFYLYAFSINCYITTSFVFCFCFHNVSLPFYFVLYWCMVNDICLLNSLFSFSVFSGFSFCTGRVVSLCSLIFKFRKVLKMVIVFELWDNEHV
jgi:hypothetical protein